MKYSILFFLTFILGCIQKEDKTTIKIISVDVGITTIISIKCNDFLDSFDSSEFKIKHLDKSTIDDVREELEGLKQEEDKRDSDTRAIIIVKDGIAIDTLCADRFTIKYRDKFYSMTDNLLKIIWTE